MAYVDTLKDLRDLYAKALKEEAQGGPGFDYSLDGESLSPGAWRDNLFKKLQDLDEMILRYECYEIRTVGI